MMKTGTHGMLKFKRLQRRLKLPLWQAIGLLEALWALTAKDAPCGDIGKFSNEDIAAWLEYDGDHDELIAELVCCGWLDASPEHRLIVHDWADHAPNFVKGNYRKKFVQTATEQEAVRPQGTIPKGPSPGDAPLSTIPPSLVKPSLVKSSQVKPPPPPTPSENDGGGGLSETANLEETPSASLGTDSSARRAENESWKSLTAKLAAMGMADASAVIRQAKLNGLTVSDASGIVAYYAKNPAGLLIGALHFRLRSAVPGQPPSEGWPPRDDSGAKAKAKAAADLEKAKESRAYVIINRGRKAKIGEDAIRRELADAGLEWPS